MCQGKEDIKIKPLKQKEWLYFFLYIFIISRLFGKMVYLWCKKKPYQIQSIRKWLNSLCNSICSISAASSSTTLSSGILRMISPFLKRMAQPSPPAMPISASRASPGPLTAQPITATVSGSLQSCSRSSTCRARPIRSILVRPQVGQETKVMPSRRRPIDFRMSRPCAPCPPR